MVQSTFIENEEWHGVLKFLEPTVSIFFNALWNLSLWVGGVLVVGFSERKDSSNYLIVAVALIHGSVR
jgi:hypothetical protein